jgi:hypothetical protein
MMAALIYENMGHPASGDRFQEDLRAFLLGGTG